MSSEPIQYCIFDVETPNRCNDRICSMGVVVVADSKILLSRTYLIDPETDFDAFNVNLTGIGPADVRGKPTFPVVWEELSDLFYCSVVVAHNASFDLGVLRKCLAAYQLPAQDIWYLCTVQASRRILPQMEGYKLDAICAYLGIPLEHHNAGSDAEACARLLLYLLAEDESAVEQTIAGCQMDCPEQKKSYRTKRQLSETSQALHDLKLLVQAVTADNQLTDGEVAFLHSWVRDNAHLKGNYPYDRILSTVNAALEDGVLEQRELDDLLDVLKSTLDPVGNCCADVASDALQLSGKGVCLTGDFERCSKKQIEAELACLGAVVQPRVTRKTDYLIVGGIGSAAWSSGNYGNKVKRALELQGQGFPIQIFREEDFFQKIEGASV